MSGQGTDDPPNVIDDIRRDHQAIEQLLARVADSGEGDRADAFDELAAYLAKHEAAEQAVVHPEIRQFDTAVAEGRESEEAKADETLDRLRGMDVESAEFAGLFAQFRQSVLEHASREERDEHPELERDVDPERLVEMASEFEEAEQRAEADAEE